ncbi:MAG: Maf family nucleotide pyrophosphatase [Flavobacteriales bacterium]
MIAQTKKIILASKSPRRQQLLKELHLLYEIRTKEIEEIYPPHLKGPEVPVFLSKLKGEAFKDELKEDELVITSDTIVWHNNEILGKPESRDHAIEILRKLSGSMHRVVTAVTLQEKHHTTTFHEVTEVYFNPISDAEIIFYIDNFQPLDKAGSYGIQEWIGYIGIEKINGCYYNVMGLPLFRLNQHLKELGIIQVR